MDFKSLYFLLGILDFAKSLRIFYGENDYYLLPTLVVKYICGQFWFLGLCRCLFDS